MRRILVLGAGRSSTVLIEYLLSHAQQWNCEITVADQSIELAQQKIGNHTSGKAIAFHAFDEVQRHHELSKSDVVVSLLPPDLHILIARDCIQFRKHLVTASYVSDEMEKLNGDATKAGLLFMCEMGLDPGIDHMSAIKIFDAIKSRGGHITSFLSGAGGLVAPESDNNPWHYKISWNPRNVVLAGQGTAQFLQDGMQKFIPYHRLFQNVESFRVKGFGKFESYPNRDSMQYISKYGLEGINTIIRSTVRKKGFCRAWDSLIQLGLTDDSYVINELKGITYAEWLAFLTSKKIRKLRKFRESIAKLLDVKVSGKVMNQLDWLGIFSDEKLEIESATPAQILQGLIEKKWAMGEGDNDMVIMRHVIDYESSKSEHYRQTCTMILKGEDVLHTAMAKTVGLPLGIMVRLLLEKGALITGVHIPTDHRIYSPVLQELAEFGIRFSEKEKKLKQ